MKWRQMEIFVIQNQLQLLMKSMNDDDLHYNFLFVSFFRANRRQEDENTKRQNRKPTAVVALQNLVKKLYNFSIAQGFCVFISFDMLLLLI